MEDASKSLQPVFPDLASVAKYIKSDECQKIVFILGAGASTSTRVPDFKVREPENGLSRLYTSLKGLNLPKDLRPLTPKDIEDFRHKIGPFYALAYKFQLRKSRPTLTHSFVRLIDEKKKLLACFTQNVDALERRAGVPETKLIEAYGSFTTHYCMKCHMEYDHELVMDVVERKGMPMCQPECHAFLRPGIRFFGEDLPDNLQTSLSRLIEADLLIIAGASLKLEPFTDLGYRTKGICPRVLIDCETVENLDPGPDDVLLLGQCDVVVKALSKKLGWYNELLDLWNPMKLVTKQPAADEVKELAGQPKEVNLGEDGADQQAPVPDTNPTNPSITSGDKVASN